MISSECVPFSKTGGLADVVGALSFSFSDLGHNVRVIVPDYAGIASDYQQVCSLSVHMLGTDEKVVIKQTVLHNVSFYFVSHDLFTGRSGVYGDNSSQPYPDNFYRYVLFSKVSLELCKKTGFKPDIIHAHDWTTGFIPYLVKHGGLFFAGTKCIFTIHNLAYQGIFSKFQFLYSDIKPDNALFRDNMVNMLYSALVFADYITTVSPTYSQEIRKSDFSCGLEQILNKRASFFSGILNGVDTQVWNPKHDKYLPYSFSRDDLKGKKSLKSLLQKTFGLPVAPDVPVFAMISRLAVQKGFDIFLNCAENILKKYRLQFVIIGTGDKELESQLKKLDAMHDNLSVNLIFSDEKAHLAEAGSDFFLMPSRYEPCGLNQMYSQIYGTIPVVHKTGGLSDTVKDLNTDPKGGTGIVFDKLEPSALTQAVERACELYESENMQRVIYNAMSEDFSWKKSALEYIDVYKLLLKKRKS